MSDEEDRVLKISDLPEAEEEALLKWEGGDFLAKPDDFLAIPSLDQHYTVHQGGIPPPAVPGAMTFDTDSGKFLVCTGDGDMEWQPLDTVSSADWGMGYYVIKVDTENVGIWSAPIDKKDPPASFTIMTHEKFINATGEQMDEVDYETMVAFNALPVMEVERESRNGVLLKFPD